MSEESMVERVARAICNPELQGPVVQAVAMPLWEEITEAQRRAYLWQARVAIAAMREPTEAMITAGTIGWKPADGGPVWPVFPPTQPYQAMIDEALKPS